jgi:N-acetylglutamate synthase-like GNAT family acetyltransferase
MFVIRQATRDDCDAFAIPTAKKLEWLPHVTEVLFPADPSGFFVGTLDNEIIGCISAVKYSSTYGFIGFFIVEEKYRGQGYISSFTDQVWSQAVWPCD